MTWGILPWCQTLPLLCLLPQHLLVLLRRNPWGEADLLLLLRSNTRGKALLLCRRCCLLLKHCLVLLW